MDKEFKGFKLVDPSGMKTSMGSRSPQASSTHIGHLDQKGIFLLLLLSVNPCEWVECKKYLRFVQRFSETFTGT